MAFEGYGATAVCVSADWTDLYRCCFNAKAGHGVPSAGASAHRFPKVTFLVNVYGVVKVSEEQSPSLSSRREGGYYDGLFEAFELISYAV